MQTQLAAQLLARYVTSAIFWQNRLPQSWLHNTASHRATLKGPFSASSANI